jgi:hypothetical protein
VCYTALLNIRELFAICQPFEELHCITEYKSCQKGAPKDKPDEEDVCPICLEGFVSLDPGLFILTRSKFRTEYSVFDVYYLHLIGSEFVELDAPVFRIAYTSPATFLLPGQHFIWVLVLFLA